MAERAHRSTRMSTSSQLQSRIGAGTQTSEPSDGTGVSNGTGPYIDWGPALPDAYPGGRARLMVANPTTVLVTWETEVASPAEWQIELVVDGWITLMRLTLPGDAREAWIQVAPRTRGAMLLERGSGTEAQVVAVLPFETPPDAPSTNTQERWGRLDAHGHLHHDARVVAGRAIIGSLEGPVASASSSHYARRERP